MVQNDSSTLSKCLVCGSTDTYIFLSLQQVPVHCNLLWPQREGALGAPRGDIELAFCRHCGYIFNQAFEPRLMAYAGAYENSLHFSPRFQAYAESLAQRLIERYDLHDKEIVEIGSGQGDFLRLLCELGGNRGFGFDPSYVADTDAGKDHPQVTFISDYYSERYARYGADLICCRHVLEHIRDPKELLTTVRTSLGDRLDAVVFFEVPNMQYTLRELAIWDIIYEHCSYFGRHALAALFLRCGFAISGIAETFAGQFLTVDAFPSREFADKALAQHDGLDLLTESVMAFAAQHQDKMLEWQSRIEGFRKANQRVVVWGAGSKGVTFLNALEVGGLVEYVIDINPRKRGMHIAGTGQHVVPPGFLREYRPDVVIVMNPAYRDEIRASTRELGLATELLCA